MPKTCEILYIGVDKKGQILPRLRGFGEIPLLHTARLPACIRKEVEVGLAMVAARGEIISTILHRAEDIYRWEPKRPLHLALAIATGTLAFGVAATAMTYYLLSK